MWGGSIERPYDDGAAFDPVAWSWRPLPPAPISPREDHIAVWTGTQMIVWGGEVQDGGASYDPQADRWAALPEAPGGTRADHSHAWSGDELVIWGGNHTTDPADAEPLASGLAFSPDIGTWRETAAAPLGPRREPVAVATGGGDVVVWGGRGCATFCSDGARYHTSEDRWSELPNAPLAGSAEGHPGAVVDGTFVIWGGQSDGARFDLTAQRWSNVEPAPLAERFDHTVTAVADEVFVWGGRGTSQRDVFSDGALFRPPKGSGSSGAAATHDIPQLLGGGVAPSTST